MSFCKWLRTKILQILYRWFDSVCSVGPGNSAGYLQSVKKAKEIRVLWEAFPFLICLQTTVMIM